MLHGLHATPMFSCRCRGCRCLCTGSLPEYLRLHSLWVKTPPSLLLWVGDIGAASLIHLLEGAIEDSVHARVQGASLGTKVPLKCSPNVFGVHLCYPLLEGFVCALQQPHATAMPFASITGVASLCVLPACASTFRIGMSIGCCCHGHSILRSGYFAAVVLSGGYFAAVAAWVDALLLTSLRSPRSCYC